MNPIYFDNAATTQIRKEVVDRMTGVMRDVPGNPSSTHAFGRTAKSQIETARKRIAELFNVTAGEIIFTSGGTCLLYTSPSPRDQRGSRMPSSA